MTRYRNPFVLALSGLLVACASEQPAVPAPAPETDAPPASVATPTPALRGQLLGVAQGADVELALLAIDLSGRPRALLGQAHLRGDGQALPFHLPLNVVPPSQTQRVELRGALAIDLGDAVQFDQGRVTGHPRRPRRAARPNAAGCRRPRHRRRSPAGR